jgi:hypothetical protein
VEAVAGEQAAQEPQAEACAAEERLPTVDGRWRPAAAGALRLEELRGDPRLTVVDRAPSAWSADSSMLAIAEDLALVVWQVRDGELVSIPNAAWSRSSGCSFEARDSMVAPGD